MVRKRGYTPKARNTGKRKMKRILLISSEGNKNNKTEHTYFANFKDKVSIKFVPGNETDPETMMDQLIKEYKKCELGKEDMAVCFVDSDFDVQRNQTLRKTDRKVQKERKNNIKLIVSSPCFEIWFLCHFQYSTKQYRDVKEILADLEKLIPNYQKSRDIYGFLAGKEETAIQNAQRLEKWCLAAGRKVHHVDFMPSTEVYKVMLWIQNRSSAAD